MTIVFLQNTKIFKMSYPKTPKRQNEVLKDNIDL